MRLYNTMTRRKEEFVPVREGEVGFYICGPTVYNHIHIGNARTFLSFDVIRRYLIYRGFKVNFVQNITDVDDKIINRANAEGRDAADVAAEYAQAFIDAMDALGVMPPTTRPKATEEIPAMLELIATLVEKGHAYVADGDVYFSVRSFPDYGRLSGRDIDDLIAGARVDVDPRKRDPEDFALWKGAKPGEPSWPSPWGEGRPGWHIECSAMSARYLGLPFDIHAGGDDLVFPHHENELAQSVAGYGCAFGNYWLHGGMLTIDREKMSKSEGNFLLLKDVLGHVRPQALRLLMLQTHYRSPFDYSAERLREATASLSRIETGIGNMLWAASQADDGAEGQPAAALADACERARARFVEEMDDDFNTAGAVAAIFELVTVGNTAAASRQLSGEQRRELARAAATIRDLLMVLGIDLGAATDDAPKAPAELVALARELCGFEGDEPTAALDTLLATRQEARGAKDWARADAIRAGFASLGIDIEDTPTGPRVIYG